MSTVIPIAGCDRQRWGIGVLPQFVPFYSPLCKTELFRAVRDAAASQDSYAHQLPECIETLFKRLGTYIEVTDMVPPTEVVDIIMGMMVQKG